MERQHDEQLRGTVDHDRQHARAAVIVDAAWVHERKLQFAAFLEHLRATDPTFAEASACYPSDEGEWHAATYLLTGMSRRMVCPRYSRALRAVDQPGHSRARAPPPAVE
jgi:hypothetical protein